MKTIAKLEREKENLKVELIKRKKLLRSLPKLIPAFIKELDEIEKVLEMYDSLPLEIFREEPGYGLTNHWTAKILEQDK